jgi:3-oxoacyl-[acyl-carrier-protein] synthase II
MGEEAAGVDAVRISLARVLAGQSDIGLVGGAYNAERIDVVLHYAMGGCLWKGEPKPLWERAAAGGGMELASMAAFLAIEEKEHAIARGAKPFARLSAVRADHVARRPGAVTATLEKLWADIAPKPEPASLAVLSGASGVDPATADERAFFSKHPGLAVRATGSHLGHGIEPQFAFNIALAAIALGEGRLFPSFDRTGFERAMDAPLRQVAVTGVGHWRGEGLALLEAVG